MARQERPESLIVGESSTLLFVSPRFLFPVDSGGKIRTTQILRGLKGGAFRIKVASPATEREVATYRSDLKSVCDEFVYWPSDRHRNLWRLARFRHWFHQWPLPIRTDWSRAAARTVGSLLAEEPAVAVFDFLHSAVLAPASVNCPTVLFTHNVETEIFERHVGVAKNWFMRSAWQSQARKMRKFEGAALGRFGIVVAVSERDASAFAELYGVTNTAVIPTGVDLDYFSFREPGRDSQVVFCGSMDWLANREAIGFFLDEIWERVTAEEPDTRMTVIGRAPPQALVQRAQRRNANWAFTGYVDDIRPYLHGAAVSVIPMRVAGGTRLKVYESMAAGVPVVSTAIGVEGLPVENGRHYLQANEPVDFAKAVISLLRDRERRRLMAAEARRFVESRFSHVVAAKAFQSACHRAMREWRSGHTGIADADVSQ